MKKLTKTDIECMAYEIAKFLSLEGMATDVRIYFNNKALECDVVDDLTYNWRLINNIDPHTYFEYAAHQHILSMSFEGKLYEILNYLFDERAERLEKIFNHFGLYYELGDAWNLTLYPIDDMEVEYTYYDSPAPRTYLQRGDMFNPEPLNHIMDTWYENSRCVGDVGSCVLGAGFDFEFKGRWYFMPAQSPYQGSISWEKNKEVVREALEEAGATQISYDWGRLD